MNREDELKFMELYADVDELKQSLRKSNEHNAALSRMLSEAIAMLSDHVGAALPTSGVSGFGEQVFKGFLSTEARGAMDYIESRFVITDRTHVRSRIGFALNAREYALDKLNIDELPTEDELSGSGFFKEKGVNHFRKDTVMFKITDLYTAGITLIGSVKGHSYVFELPTHGGRRVRLGENAFETLYEKSPFKYLDSDELIATIDRLLVSYGIDTADGVSEKHISEALTELKELTGRASSFLEHTAVDLIDGSPVWSKTNNSHWTASFLKYGEHFPWGSLDPYLQEQHLWKIEESIERAKKAMELKDHE